MTSVAGKVLCMCGHARAVHYDTGAWRNCCATGCACLNFQSAESFERAGPSRQPAPLAQPTPPLTAKQITEICHLLHTGANYADDFSDAAEAANEGEEIEWDVDGMKNGRRDAVKLREASERARHSTP